MLAVYLEVRRGDEMNVLGIRKYTHNQKQSCACVGGPVPVRKVREHEKPFLWEDNNVSREGNIYREQMEYARFSQAYSVEQATKLISIVLGNYALCIFQRPNIQL